MYSVISVGAKMNGSRNDYTVLEVTVLRLMGKKKISASRAEGSGEGGGGGK